MNIQDYFAPIDGSSKIANYFELKALLEAQEKAKAIASVIKQPSLSNQVEVKTESSTNSTKEIKPNSDIKWLTIGALVAISAIAYFAYHKHKNDEV